MSQPDRFLLSSERTDGEISILICCEDHRKKYPGNYGPVIEITRDDLLLLGQTFPVTERNPRWIFLQQNMMDKRSVQQRSLAPSGQSLIDASLFPTHPILGAEVKKRLAKTEEEEDKK
ncbi:hypothetical protein FCULG_00010924 [Fusarium culmorum]|uniref:Uncharacterized protein n=1 Tax=Fusarium culmorum TaxID=5516 RepID=A0A2T4GYW1_FUSCU|nr:hypothetical protein FCULG_00010924 [Fusarium culmorum]